MAVALGVSPRNLFQSFADLTQFIHDAGARPAIVNIYQSWGPSSDTSTRFRPDVLDQIRALGATPMVTWMSWDYSLPQTDQPAYALSNIINGEFDASIARWARGAKAWGHPFFLRFDHEMNGPFWPWGEGANGNTAGQYALAWQHVHNIFTQVGASDVAWVWCPNAETADLRTHGIADYYPGDAYTDWVGLDGYNWGASQSWSRWQTFSEVFDQSFQDVAAFAPAKPVLIAEIGCAEAGGSKAAWITDALMVQAPRSPVRALCWFNVDLSSQGQADWRIESSPAAQQAFAAAAAALRDTCE